MTNLHLLILRKMMISSVKKIAVSELLAACL